jgi:hypothetical protein
MTDRTPKRPHVVLRTGAETPVDPEDLCMAAGRDPTPENIEKYRMILEEKGARAVEEIVP